MSVQILTNATLATMSQPAAYSLILSSSLVVEDDRIAWLGSDEDMPKKYKVSDCQLIDCKNKVVTPGLIDCHTHLVYGSHRAQEFEMRLEGASYEEIARSGGGINSTVKHTREASEAELIKKADKRLKDLMDEGVTTVEIKSGYGLDAQNEIKMLKVASTLAEQNSIRVQKTFLGAHALPPEYQGDKEAYIDVVCSEMLSAAVAANLVDAVDGFCEGIAFSVEQMERVFDKAEELGLSVKLHAEQLSHLGGAVMASNRGALSVDHIEYLQAEEAEILAKNNTVAVLLPGAFYTLKETQLPPVQALREQNVPIAIATDLNPGSSPLHSILLTMNMACTLFGLTPTEALAGVTINAAKALGLDNEIGSLEVGKCADLVVWDIDHPAVLSYEIGANHCQAVMAKGQWRKNNLIQEQC